MSSNSPELSRAELEARLAHSERELEQLRRAKRRVGLSFHRVPETGSQIEALSNGSFPYFIHVPECSYTLKDRRIHETAKGSPLSESTDGNITLVEGDNLPVLAALQQTHRGRVDVIYIDPPYNTGNNDFIYNDARMSSVTDVEGASFDDYEKTLDGKARTVGKDDPERHSLWLSFMERRLFLAKELLSETGVIILSIDDNEQARLKLLMDEVFGVDNFVANLIWRKTDTLKNDARFISSGHEYALIYAKSIENLPKFNGVQRNAEQEKAYKNLDGDPRGDYRLTPLYAKSGTESTTKFTYTFSNGQVWSPPEGRFNRFALGTLGRLDEENRLLLDPKGKNQPMKKTYRSEVNSNIVLSSLLPHDIFVSTRISNLELSSLMGKGIFQNPKPSQFVKALVNAVTGKKDAIILDFFAGSGTTGHAVVALNKEDGGTRQCILVTHGDEDGKNIAEDVTAERMRRVLSGENWADKKPHESFPGELNYYKLAFADKQSNPETTVELLQTKFIGYAALQQDVVAVIDQPDPEHFIVMKNTKKTVVVVKDQNFVEDEFDKFNEVLETLQAEALSQSATGNNVKLVIYIPSSSEFDEYGFEEMGWNYIPFSLEYVKSHGKLINRMKANGTLLPLATGVEYAAIINPNVESTKTKAEIENGENN